MVKSESGISIITATYNAADYLPRLIESLRSQSNQDFEWVVADGASTDNTLAILSDVDDLDVVIDSRADFGIYDALNRAIGMASGDYYLVLGADDIIYPDTVVQFYECIKSQKIDIATAKINVDGLVSGVRRPWPWLYGQFAYVSSHAVGTLISKKLHSRYGMYSRRFPIAADQLFLKQVGDDGDNILKADFIAGEFSLRGMSGNDTLGALTEGFRVQLATGENKLLQCLIFVARLIKNYRRL